MKYYTKNILIFVFILIQIQMFAQSTWQTAQSISHNSTTTITSANTDYWFSFVAQTNEVGFNIDAKSNNSNEVITNIELYELNASTINLLESNTRDSSFTIAYMSLVKGNTYYIKVVNSNPSEQWTIEIKNTVVIVYPDYSCPPACNNLVFNGDFDDVFSTVTLYPTSRNGLYGNPFNEILDGNMYADGYIYDNMVCTWHSPTGTPQIKQLNGSNAAYMFCDGSNIYGTSIPESITTWVDLIAWEEYTIEFNYKLYNTYASGLNATGSATIKFLQSAIVDDSNYDDPGLTIPSLTANINSTPHSYTFTPQQDYKSLVIYPNNSTTGRNHFNIDNIVVKATNPPEEIPIISGPSNTCNQSGSMNYTIVNFDHVHPIYQYQINYGTIETVSSSTFNISSLLFDQQVNIIKIWNDCNSELYTEFKVYECCTPTDYTLFADENLTNTKLSTVTNSQIVINGTVNIHDNIILNSFDVKFGPMAKVIVDEGYNLTINGGTLEDGCNYPWDGIYIDNSDATTSSKLTINDVTSIKGAYNAVVSSNNAEIELTNNHFINNDKGVKIRNYKPNLCELSLNQPPTVVPSYNAIITGNTFEIISSQYPYGGFGNLIGIQIDTVYDITIGNENSAQNIFKNLDLGITVNSSWVEIYNNKFEDINNGTYEPILSTNNKPSRKIAILATKIIVPSTTNLNYTALNIDECVASKIIVGKTGTNGGNEFDNCDFGVYSYKHYTEVINNTFDDQICNAVWVWDNRCIVNDNTIEQKVNTWFSNANLNTAILIEKTANPTAIYNFQLAEVKNNTITNTRTGISLIHCSSLPFSSSTKTVVQDNNITFNYYYPTGTVDYRYTGIWISACNRAIIRGNSIQNYQGNTSNYSEYQSLIGIRIDATSEAQISHNFDLNYLGTGIWVNGNCLNTQFSCNTFKTCKKGIYTYSPLNSSGYAAVISDQGSLSSGRPQDNFFSIMQAGTYVSGDLNTVPNNSTDPKWHYRTSHFSYKIISVDKHDGVEMTNPLTSCTNGIIPDPDDPNDYTYAVYIDELYGKIIRNEMDYIELEDEFEYFDDKYLYEVLYNNPEIMNLGEPEDVAYQNFYNYLTNSNVREFMEVQELIDEGDINQALMDNGSIVAQNVIEANIKYVNEVYLNSFAQDKYFTESERQTLYTIAMLTPYIGGDAVYSARVMLGINPNTYNLAYRRGNISDSSGVSVDDNILKTYPNPAKDKLILEFDNSLESNAIFTLFDVMGREVMQVQLSNGNKQFELNTSTLESGIYFYKLSNNDNIKGKIIIDN